MARGDLADDQKKAEAAPRTLVFVDESAFYLLPATVSTSAPIGETPIIRAPGSYDHLSVISGSTPAGKLRRQVSAPAIRGEPVVAFLEHLLRHQAGQLLVIWDGASIQRWQAVKQCLRDGGAERIWLARLPAYAPDLTPDEGIWQYLKYVALRNGGCADRDELRSELRLAIARVRHKPDITPGCIVQAGLSL